LSLTTLSLRVKLTLLLGGALALAFTIGAAGIISLHLNHQSLETVYSDRVVPLEQLKSVSDDYAVLIIDAVNKANAGIMTAPEALTSIRRARARIRETWQNYLATWHTPEEEALARAAAERFHTLEPVLNNLEQDLERGPAAREGTLGRFDGPLYTLMDPVSEKIHELVDLQLRVAAEEYAAGGRTYSNVTWGVGLAMGAGGLLMLIAGGALVRHTNQSLEAIVRELREGAGQLSATADHLSQANTMIAQGASEQAGAQQEISSTQHEASSLAEQNSERARACVSSMGAVGDAFSRATQSVEEVSSVMGAIEESGRQMQTIMRMIEDIAFQTNILSLNASVEAARAGEHGRGFAVVAGEVRSLALRSAEAAKNTSGIIDESARRSADGTRQVRELGASMEQASRLAAQSRSLVEEIAGASQLQSRNAGAISSALRQIEQAAQGNAAAAEQGASASEELQAQFHSLLHVVSGLETMMDGAHAGSHSDCRAA
jgi:hypothetical protein